MKPLFKISLLFVSILAFYSCKQEANKVEEIITIEDSKQEAFNRELFYHYSIWYAFVNKVYEGNLTVKELKTKGDIGLGSYNQLDGELVMLDGIPYQVTEDGVVHVPNDDAKIVYVNATFFEEDASFKIEEPTNYEGLRAKINEKLPCKNVFYGFKIHGEFKKMTCGGLHKQEPPYTEGLDVLIPNRPVFEAENITGTMVGFFCPEFIGNINVAAYHLHFISDDKKLGGHVMEFEANSLNVAMDEMLQYQFVLPDSKEYRDVGFEKEFQYKKK
jgi:acetolactate decarboxylase